MSTKDSKCEGNGESTSSQRLPKLFSKTPELLLNTSKNSQRAQANKKSYAPNLNVTRNKNTDTKSNDRDPKKEFNRTTKNQRGKDGKAQNNFNKRNQSNIVQTAGVFTEGIASVPILRNRPESSGSYSRDVSIDSIPKPRLKKETKTTKEEIESDQKALSDLLGDDDEDMEDNKQFMEDIVPVKIKHVQLNSSVPIDVKIKVETNDYVKTELPKPDIPITNGNLTSTISSSSIKTEPGFEIKSEEFHRMDGLFNTSHNHFMLFQMPDTLPGPVEDDEDEKTESNEAHASTSNLSPIKKKPLKLCKPEDFQEGLIGKLVRYKSGKTKLMIGDMHYDVDIGLGSDFLQHAVTFDANPQQRSANMYSLGEVHGKYNVMPCWESLFEALEVDKE